ncbi:hypothetical protein [Ferrimonas marina]|uniref:Uncharacterized protein n=1 Tax=Ferrimonas marina TaxID=299255 RepID=A0A1M5NVM3_9GAMM|nr:hypothetical protein [Ferrimonas marina]SHG93528.1 hypothetical protein SAMN02745129_1193 [Ferrimonas marina]
MIEIITTVSLWELSKHAASWLVNLRRAKQSRRQESIAALRQVILASRQTRIWLQQPSISPEQQQTLATLWTELSFTLSDLGVEKLAKRCDLAGAQWQWSPNQAPEALARTQAQLAKLEGLAQALLAQLQQEHRLSESA